jgi:hypothetical protein
MAEQNQDRTEFLATARKRFEAHASDEKEIRDEAEKDLRYVAGDQWDEGVRAEREAKGLPCLTFNRMPTFVANISNEARDTKPEMKFAPEQDDELSTDTAEVIEGMARHIQYDSDAQVASETAVFYSAAASFGFIGLTTDYCDDESFDLDLKVRAFLNPFAVYGVLIPTALGQEPTSAFVIEELTHEEYKAQYPDSEVTSAGFDAAGYDSAWIGSETVRVAEYWYVEHERTLIENKETGGKRYVQKPTVHSCKINGHEVLPDTETVWPGRRIPIWAVTGAQMIVANKPQLFSVVRFQRDPQLLINSYKSRIAQTLGTSPVQPFMAAAEAIEGHEDEWNSLSSTPTAYLPFNATRADGTALPIPQRQVFEAPIRAFAEAAAAEIDDMKAVSGIFDASLGAQSNETSGIAIARRDQQGDRANMHYMDNLARTFKGMGTEMVYVIPKVYDTERMVDTLGADEQPKIVRINAQHQDQNGRMKHYKVGGDDAIKGKVIVTMGRSYSTKRMESYDFMVQLVQAHPNAFPMIADVLFRNSDTAGADVLAERFKQIGIKQGFIQDDQQQQNVQLPPQVQQIVQQHGVLVNEVKQLTQMIEQKQAEAQSKVDLEKLKLDYAVRLKQMDIDKALAIAEIQTKAQDRSERVGWQRQLVSDMNDHAHEAGMTAMQHGQNLEALMHEHANALEQGDQAHVQNLDMASVNAANAQHTQPESNDDAGAE